MWFIILDDESSIRRISKCVETKIYKESNGCLEMLRLSDLQGPHISPPILIFMNKGEIQKFSNLYSAPDFPWHDFIIIAEVSEVSGYW